jgi:hypothetical protein
LYFKLAERLGMTVRQMLASMDSAELTEWLVMDQWAFWKERVESANDRSKKIFAIIAGRAISRGAVRRGQ